MGGSALLTTLDLTFPLVLRQAASPSFTPLSTSLLAHDAAQKGTHFAAQTFSCPLCLTALKGRHCLTLEACPLPATVGEGKHTFCRACLESYFTLLITEGLVRNVCCPAVECTRERVKWEREEEQGGRDGATRSSRPGEVGRVELLGIVGEEMTARWEALKEKQRLEAGTSALLDSALGALRSRLTSLTSRSLFARRSVHFLLSPPDMPHTRFCSTTLRPDQPPPLPILRLRLLQPLLLRLARLTHPLRSPSLGGDRAGVP